LDFSLVQNMEKGHATEEWKQRFFVFFVWCQYLLPSRTYFCWAKLCWACSILTQLCIQIREGKLIQKIA
jgi:hypothetical protein